MGRNLARTEAGARSEGLQVRCYDVALELPPDADAFTSRTTVEFDASPGMQTFLDCAAATIRSVRVNGELLDPGDVFRDERVWLPPLQRTNVVEVEADFTYSRSAEGLHRFVDPVDNSVYLFTQFEPNEARRMFACFDQPDLKASWSLQVTCPTSWTVVSTTRPQVRKGETDRSRVWSFPPSPRLSTYVYALAAGPYHRAELIHSGLSLGLYCRASIAARLDAEELFALTRTGLDFFQDRFATPYPYDKYDQVFVPEFNIGGMENAASVFLTEELLFRSKVTRADRRSRAEFLLHEMAHMWFGDLVTMRWWDDLWLNESFATYASNDALTNATQFREAWAAFCSGGKAYALGQDLLATTHPVVADAPDIDTATANFDAITYHKGSALLKQLVAFVGEKEFWSGVAAYLDERRWDNAELSDLLRNLEQSSGKDLSQWRDEWLLTSGANVLRPRLTVDQGRYLTVEVEQTGTPPRDHRIAVGLYSLEGQSLVRTRRVEVDIHGPVTSVPELVGCPVADVVLVNDDDLTFAQTRLDPASWTGSVRFVDRLEDPLARALIWTSAWGMTRDAEVTTAQFLQLVRSGILHEPDVGVVERLLDQSRTAIVRYGAPALTSARLEGLSSFGWQAARAAAHDDHRLGFARAAIANAVTPEQVALLHDLLAGRGLVEGLVIDTEMRWAIVQRLAALGALDPDMIDAEAARDVTAAGSLQRLAALAARPDADSKKAVWHQILHDESLTNHEIRARIEGYCQPEQAELLIPRTAEYFTAVRTTWTTRSSETATTMLQAQELFPLWDVSQRCVDLADDTLAGSLPTSLRRLVTNGRDEVVRALSCRALDAAI